MVKVILVTFDGLEWPIDHFDTVEEAIQHLYTYWNEDEGPQTFFIMGQDGRCLVTLMRDLNDVEVCHTTYADGTHCSHRCHYLHGEDGAYVETEVTQLT